MYVVGCRDKLRHVADSSPTFVTERLCSAQAAICCRTGADATSSTVTACLEMLRASMITCSVTYSDCNCLTQQARVVSFVSAMLCIT